MPETDYPEWLVDRVAKPLAFSQNPRLESRWDDEDWEDGRKFWRDDAIAVLDELGFHTLVDGGSYWLSGLIGDDK